MGEDSTAIRQQIEETRDRMSDTVDALGHKADVPARAKESIGGTVRGVREKVYGTGSQISDSVSDATPDASDVRDAGQRAVSVAERNPLGLAIGAAALGFLAGMLIPATPAEDQRIGPVSDQLKLQARSTGEEAVEHGREVLGDVADVAQDKAQEFGDQVTQSAQDAAESAKNAAGEVKDQAAHSAQDHAEDLGDSARENAQAVQDTAGQQGS